VNEFLRTILFLPSQSSTIARDIDGLHYFVIIVTMLGATAVALFAGYFILKYRRSAARGTLGLDANAHHGPGGMPYWLEFAVIAFLLVLFLVWWIIGFRQFVHIQTPPANTLDIHVTGKQWMWTFVYPSGHTSNGVLYVPTNRPVRLIMSSRDVIHSFFVPQFRVKKDVVPGRVTELWFEVEEPGVYPVFCTEYCGEGHSTMRAEVVALTGQNYVAAIEELDRLQVPGPRYVEPAVVGQVPGEPVSLAEMGERVAVTQGCLRCHTADGTPHIGPTWAGVFGTRVELEDGNEVVADAAYLTESMMDPNAKIRRGYPALMPSYQGLLTAAEVGALVEYIRELAREPRELRASPLVPPTAPSIELPTESPRTLVPVVPGPLVGTSPTRADGLPGDGAPANGAPQTNGAPASGAPQTNGSRANGSPQTNGAPASGTPQNDDARGKGAPRTDGAPAKGSRTNDTANGSPRDESSKEKNPPNTGGPPGSQSAPQSSPPSGSRSDGATQSEGTEKTP